VPPSFGKRTQGSGADGPLPPSGERSRPGRGLTRLVILCLVLGIGALSLPDVLTRVVGRAIEAQLEAPFREARAEVVAHGEQVKQVLAAQSRATAPAALVRIHQLCQARAERITQNTPVPTLFSPMSQGPNPEASVVLGNAYLDCLMTEQPKRFCNGADRLHLAGALHAHLVVMTQVRRARQVTTRDTKLMVVRDRLFGRAPPSTDFPSNAFDPRLAERLRDLASRGYVEKRDFGLGWLGTGVPAEVDAALQGIVPAPHGCDA
jgi:hypothetical protein